MQKIAVIYWSGTGNTETMAKCIGDGIKEAGAEAHVLYVTEFAPAKISEYDKIAFGCPSMGAEVLEEGEFEPFFTGVEAMLKDKKVALFGSYGWGDGQWMRDWQERVTGDGAVLFEEGVVINEAPDDEGSKSCVDFGKRFAEF